MMSNDSPATTKEIPAESWEAWLDTFSNGNRGRPVSIELVGDEIGDEPLAKGVPLVAIDYDPVDKGNDFVISYGQEAAPTRHIIEAPVRLWQAQAANGLVVSLQIEDQSGRRTILSF
jgi:hypothetical protein